MFKVPKFQVLLLLTSAKMADKGTTKNVNMQEKGIKMYF
jgi:hypothetical protein